MEWNCRHMEELYYIIEGKWAGNDIESFERCLADLGIKWAELDDVHDAPEGTVAIHEGLGIEDPDKRMCWVIPDDVALKLLAIGIP